MITRHDGPADPTTKYSLTCLNNSTSLLPIADPFVLYESEADQESHLMQPLVEASVARDDHISDDDLHAPTIQTKKENITNIKMWERQAGFLSRWKWP